VCRRCRDSSHGWLPDVESDGHDRLVHRHLFGDEYVDSAATPESDDGPDKRQDAVADSQVPGEGADMRTTFRRTSSPTKSGVRFVVWANNCSCGD